MANENEPLRPTRLLFLGEASLADGFRLIGFETRPDPSPQEVDLLLRELCRNRQKAFVVVDDQLMRAGLPQLERVRNEGGRILVIAVPRLNAPPVLASEVADRLTALFGAVGTTPDESKAATVNPP
jgi:vacuolar-type H+-ATPase subunit F/Vma7